MKTSAHLNSFEYVRCPPAYLRLSKITQESDNAHIRSRVFKLCRWEEIKLELAGMTQDGEVFVRTTDLTSTVALEEAVDEGRNHLTFLLILIVGAVVATTVITSCYKRFGLDRRTRCCRTEDDIECDVERAAINPQCSNRPDGLYALEPPRYSELSVRSPPKYESVGEDDVGTDSDTDSCLKMRESSFTTPPPYEETSPT